MMTFKSTIGSLVEDAIYTWIFHAEDEEKAFDMAYEHWKDCDYVDHGTMDVELIYSVNVHELKNDENRNHIWIVEWIPQKDAYRIYRFSNPSQTVGYDDYWENAIWNDINMTYPEWELILVKFENGMCSFTINPAKFDLRR